MNPLDQAQAFVVNAALDVFRKDMRKTVGFTAYAITDDGREIARANCRHELYDGAIQVIGTSTIESIFVAPQVIVGAALYLGTKCLVRKMFVDINLENVTALFGEQIIWTWDLTVKVE